MHNMLVSSLVHARDGDSRSSALQCSLASPSPPYTSFTTCPIHRHPFLLDMPMVQVPWEGDACSGVCVEGCWLWWGISRR